MRVLVLVLVWILVVACLLVLLTIGLHVLIFVPFVFRHDWWLLRYAWTVLISTMLVLLLVIVVAMLKRLLVLLSCFCHSGSGLCFRANNWVRKIPQPWEYDDDGNPINHNVPSSRWGCKIFFCKGCFRMENEDGSPHTNAWDYRAPSRGLMVRCVPRE
jgi:hypothetical protein